MHLLRHPAAQRVAVLVLAGALLAGCGGKPSTSNSVVPTAPHDAAAAPQQTYRAQMSHIGGVPARERSSPSLANRRAVRDIGGALPAITLNVLWEVDTGDGYSYSDLMTTPSSSERSSFPSAGQTWYLPAGSIAGTTALHRLFKNMGWTADHMDSPAPGEGGFSTEGVHGYMYNGGVVGTAPIFRYHNPSGYNDDHSTPGPHNLPSGYTREGPMGYGYPRWGLTGSALVQFSGGGITGAVNQVAGAAVWSWVWNGIEFVNTNDYGREIQSAFFYGNQNPTEAGDVAVSGDVQDMHGSPVASLTVTGDGISTRALPLEWNPGISGASADQIALYNTVQLGKDIHMNYNNMGGVAQYVTSLTLPNAISNGSLEMPTGYLKSGFNRFYTFDSSNGATTEVHPPVCNTGANVQYGPPSGYGGVIISNGDQTAAQGIYGALKSVGGPAGYFTLWDFTNGGCPYQTSKWDIVTDGNFPAGTSTYNSYVVTGTLAQVQQMMRALYGTR